MEIVACDCEIPIAQKRSELTGAIICKECKRPIIISYPPRIVYPSLSFGNISALDLVDSK